MDAKPKPEVWYARRVGDRCSHACVRVWHGKDAKHMSRWNGEEGAGKAEFVRIAVDEKSAFAV